MLVINYDMTENNHFHQYGLMLQNTRMRCKKLKQLTPNEDKEEKNYQHLYMEIIYCIIYQIVGFLKLKYQNIQLLNYSKFDKYKRVSGLLLNKFVALTNILWLTKKYCKLRQKICILVVTLLSIQHYIHKYEMIHHNFNELKG